MLEVSSDVKPVAKQRKERNSEVKEAIRETLDSLSFEQSFVVEGKIKKNTVKKIAKEMNVEVKFGIGEDQKLRCWKK